MTLGLNIAGQSLTKTGALNTAFQVGKVLINGATLGASLTPWGLVGRAAWWVGSGYLTNKLFEAGTGKGTLQNAAEDLGLASTPEQANQEQQTSSPGAQHDDGGVGRDIQRLGQPAPQNEQVPASQQPQTQQPGNQWENTDQVIPSENHDVGAGTTSRGENFVVQREVDSNGNPTGRERTVPESEAGGGSSSPTTESRGSESQQQGQNQSQDDTREAARQQQEEQQQEQQQEQESNTNGQDDDDSQDTTDDGAGDGGGRPNPEDDWGVNGPNAKSLKGMKRSQVHDALMDFHADSILGQVQKMGYDDVIISGAGQNKKGDFQLIFDLDGNSKASSSKKSEVEMVQVATGFMNNKEVEVSDLLIESMAADTLKM